jgi:F-type H+-transporting ATPase subunit gamma
MKITSAMKMVSAAKLKKSHDHMLNTKPYSTGLSKTIQHLLPNINHSEIKLTANFSLLDKILIVPITSNRGLCGGFNNNIFKKIKNYKKENIDVFGIGKKGIELFKKNHYNIIDTEISILDNPTFALSKPISEKIINDFANGRWSRVEIIYNTFKNAATQIIASEQLLPVVVTGEDLGPPKTRKDYIFEPNKTKIINSLIPNKIHIQVFEAILNSIASEHGARMTAMHKATDNANDLKQSLTLSYNRQRQAAITNEILEIVAGAEALKGS